MAKGATIQLFRAATAGPPPALANGELGVDFLSSPAHLWVGTPSGMLDLLTAGGPSITLPLPVADGGTSVTNLADFLTALEALGLPLNNWTFNNPTFTGTVNFPSGSTLDSPNFTGTVTINGDTAATEPWVNNLITGLNLSGTYAPLTNPASGQNNYLPIAGPTYTGDLTGPNLLANASGISITADPAAFFRRISGGLPAETMQLGAGAAQFWIGNIYASYIAASGSFFAGLVSTGSETGGAVLIYNDTMPVSIYGKAVGLAGDLGYLSFGAYTWQGPETPPGSGLYPFSERRASLTHAEELRFLPNQMTFYTDDGLTIDAPYPTSTERFTVRKDPFGVTKLTLQSEDAAYTLAIGAAGGDPDFAQFFVAPPGVTDWAGSGALFFNWPANGAYNDWTVGGPVALQIMSDIRLLGGIAADGALMGPSIWATGGGVRIFGAGTGEGIQGVSFEFPPGLFPPWGTVHSSWWRNSDGVMALASGSFYDPGDEIPLGSGLFPNATVRAGSTHAEQLWMETGTLTFMADTGLTPGAPYPTPTRLLWIDGAGNLHLRAGATILYDL